MEIQDVDVGLSHSIVLSDTGLVWLWGSNTAGQLGNGESGEDKYNNAVPIQNIFLTDIVDVSAGYDHSIALKKDGSVWTWGSNKSGQLGVEPDSSSHGFIEHVPVEVDTLVDIIMVDAGSDHNLALRKDGTVWAWGDNEYGQLGDGTVIGHTTPVQVLGLADVAAISAGANYSVALCQDGTVWAWGNDGSGRANLLLSTPSKVEGLTDVQAVSAGGGFGLALLSDGTVWTWGDYGASITGMGVALRNPVQVPGLADVIAISAGLDHSLALKEDGTVWAWGSNQAGRLGVGSSEDWSSDD